ncbi:hypothetical protein HanHA300_Chr13g0478911 [Helianthus annuus]|nr:hypothetical protein HanHA300_Chr13g0478911 [Helianthus annuus]
MSFLNTCWLIIWVLAVLSYIMTGRGRVPPPGDVSSGRGRGRGRTSDSRHGRGRASHSGGGRGSASDSGIGRGRASDSGVGRGRGLDSGAGRGRATDSGAGRGRASDSGIGPERASNSGRGNGRVHTIELSPGYSRTLGRGYAGSSSRAGDADPMADMQGYFDISTGRSFNMRVLGDPNMGLTWLEIMPSPMMVIIMKRRTQMVLNLPLMLQPLLMVALRRKLSFGLGWGLEMVKFIGRSECYLMNVLMELGQHTEKSLRNMWTVCLIALR